MLATTNSAFHPQGLRRRDGPLFTILLLLFTHSFVPVAAAQTQTQAELRERAGRVFKEAQSRYQRDMNHAEAAWHFSRACFDWAELATNNTQRAAIAELGVAGRVDHFAAGGLENFVIGAGVTIEEPIQFLYLAVPGEEPPDRAGERGRETLGPAVIARFDLQYSATFYATPTIPLGAAIEKGLARRVE